MQGIQLQLMSTTHGASAFLFHCLATDLENNSAGCATIFQLPDNVTTYYGVRASVTNDHRWASLLLKYRKYFLFRTI